MKSTLRSPASVRATLERIRQEAVAKAHKGIADKRVKPKTDPVQDVLNKLRAGVRGPIATTVSKRMGAKVASEFLSTMQEIIAEIASRTQSTPSLTAAARTVTENVVIYPDGCRLLHVNPDGRGVAVVEQPPQVRTIYISNGKRHLPMPYVVFLVTFVKGKGRYEYTGIQVGFSSVPISSLEDVLYHPPLPNFGGHGVCMGSYSGTSSEGPNEIVNDVIGAFWQSVFGDVRPSFLLGGKRITSWQQWEDLASNPLSILKAKFSQGDTINDLIGLGGGGMLSTEDRNNLHYMVNKAYRSVSEELDTEQGEVLVQLAAQEILNRLLDELTLQPRKSE